MKTLNSDSACSVLTFSTPLSAASDIMRNSITSSSTKSKSTFVPSYRRQHRHSQRSVSSSSSVHLPSRCDHHAFCYLFAQRRVPNARRPSALDSGVGQEVFKMGVLADVQYGRLPTKRSTTTVKTTDGRSFRLRRRRAWNETLDRLRQACTQFNKADVDLIVSLGDIIEGYHDPKKNSAANDAAAIKEATADLKRTLDVFSSVWAPLCHVVGNHCRSIPKRTLHSALGLPPGCAYYVREPAPGWRLVFLDTAQLCGSAVDASSTEIAALRRVVSSERRPRHWFHGALADNQLTWLRSQLDTAVELKQRVIILSHYPLADGAARASHVVANTSDVRGIIEADATPVVLCLAGHDHIGGLMTVPKTVKRGAVTYATFPAILEAPSDGNAFGILTAHSDGSIVIEAGTNSPVTCVIPGQAVQKPNE